MFELLVADRDALLTTSPLQDRSDNKSKLNPFKCADQWGGATQTGPRLGGKPSKRQDCDWTEFGHVSEIDQPHGALEHQAGNG